MSYNYYAGVIKEKTKIVPVILALLLTVGLVLSQFIMARAATTTVTVSQNNKNGWVFNNSPANATPYEFTDDESSIGTGSLFVEPIGSIAAHKFIAAKSLGIPAGDLNSIAYDFKIAGNGDSTDASQFYLNVYVNLPGSTTFFDCRFDYAPTTGNTATFTTAQFASTDLATNVDDRFDGTPRADDGYNCPSTLAQMAIDHPTSTVKFFSLNVGDTTTSDVGLAGYLDNVIVNSNSDTTTYDFERLPFSKDECKKNGWATFSSIKFKNQGDCVSFVVYGK